ncbi:ribosomal S17-domain-containing protein [Mycena olivaceomarginata]|nr:ribosomal S17-domain-containing protein [Mycena olivaceomarginata]
MSSKLAAAAAPPPSALPSALHAAPRLPPPLRSSEGYPRLTLDFCTNKCIIDEVVVVPSKQLHNKISGFTNHLMKRIQKGPVRGISFKLQEEERAEGQLRPRGRFPAIFIALLCIPNVLQALLIALNFDLIPVLVVVPITSQPECGGPGGGSRRERRNILGAAPVNAPT